MAYADYELSDKQGRPYFLYLFTDDTEEGTARLTTHPETLTRMTEEWSPSSIQGGKFEQNGNIEKQFVEFVFPLSDTFARRFLAPLTAQTSVTVYRGHLNDPDNETRVYYKGRVKTSKTAPQTITLVVENLFTSMRMTGCRVRVQRTCRWAVYRPGCYLDKTDFKVEATVSVVSGLTLTVAEAGAADPGDYKAGLINWNGIWGMIEIHSGTTLTLLTEIPGLETWVDDNGPADVLIYPGCVRTKARCVDRFDNGLNHGGWDKLPKVNPFSTGIL